MGAVEEIPEGPDPDREYKAMKIFGWCSCSDGVKGKLELRRTLLNTLRNILQPLRALSYVALSSGADTNEPLTMSLYPYSLTRVPLCHC
ncbi:unnamed protein product [Boreogadus saida]